MISRDCALHRFIFVCDVLKKDMEENIKKDIGSGLMVSLPMSFYGLMSFFQKNYILYMLCMREHVYRTNGANFILAVQQS